MSSLSLSRLFHERSQAVPTPPVREVGSIAIIGSCSLESLVERVIERLPSVPVQGFAYLDGERSSMESQQMDVAQREAMIAGIQTQLSDFAKSHPATGPIHVYLLDGKGLGAGDEGSQATLTALASKALSDPAQTVAAFLPEDESLCAKTPEPEASSPKVINDVLHRFLDAQGVTSVEGLDGLVDYLATFTPTTPPAAPAPDNSTQGG